MPFLVKTGGFVRHWLRAERKANAATRARAPPGVCWLCLGGTENCPFEDVNLNAKWAVTSTTPPWETTPALLSLYHCPSCPETFFRPDIFHNYHGGLGMYFIASAIVECMSLVPGTIDDKVQHFAGELQLWATRPGNRLPHSGPFTRERVGLTSFQVLPEARWSKFDDTRVYHSFLQNWMEKREDQVNGDALLSRVLQGLRSINRMFHILYTSGLWMEPHETSDAARSGRKFLRGYCELAHMCYNSGRLRFPMVVKMHMVDHQVRKMLGQSKHPWSLNVLSESVQADEESVLQICIFLIFFHIFHRTYSLLPSRLAPKQRLLAEDFVGQCARISRRISPKNVPFRTLQRYLTRAKRVWQKPKTKSKGYASNFEPVMKKQRVSSG